MNRFTTALLLVPSVGVVASQAVAQQSAGPLVGSPLAIAVDGGTNGSADASTHVHRNGYNIPLVRFPAFPGAPDLQSILAQHGAPNLDIDDVSTGRDDIMCNATGTTLVPPAGWGFFSFSFENGAVGVPGSRLAAEPAADRGSAVFTWVLPGSFIPSPLIDRVERAYGRRELFLSSGNDVDSLDLPLALGRDQGNLIGIEPGFPTLLPLQSSIYFTVANNSLAAVPNQWWSYGGVPTPPSGATVFVTRQASLTAGWTRPQIYKAYFELGLSASEDIDGLALNDLEERLIFSCVGNARDQLLYVDASLDFPTPVPVTKPGGTPVSQAVGTAGNDDIDAVCTLDPRIRNGLYVPDDFGASCGTPRDPFNPALYPVGVNGSAFRRHENGQSFYDTWVTGWPPNTGRGPGFAILIITLGDTTSPAFTAAFLPRNPGSAIVGDPQRFSQPIPPAFILSGVSLTFRWFATNAAGTEISQAYPIKVFL